MNNDLVKQDYHSKKLTDWKNEPTVKKLQEDLQNAMSSHQDHVSKIDTWLDNLHIRGNAKIPKQKGRSAIQPKVVRKQAEWRYAALSEPFLSDGELFKVDPVSWEDREAANQNALILNNQFATKINTTRFIDEYVRAAVNEGTAIAQVGWYRKEKEIKETVPVFEYMPVNPEQQEEIQQRVQQLIALREKGPDSFNRLDDSVKEMIRILEESGQLVIPQQVGEKEVTKTKVVANHPTVNICDYRSIIVDPTCEGDITKANFIINSFTSSLAELKDTGLYTNLEEIGVERVDPLTMPDDEFSSLGFQFKDKPRQKFTVYEYWGYWDIDNSGLTKSIVAAWVGNTLIRLEENPYPDGELPFVMVSYMPVKRSLYGEPDGELLEDQQKVIGALTRGIIDLLGKSANSQTGIPKDLLDSVNLKKFNNGQDYLYNPVNASPHQSIYQHTYPDVPDGALTLIQMMNTDAEAITGVKSFSTGGGITGANLGDVAAGIRGALDAASKREMGILRRLANGVVQIGRKIIAMNAEFLEEEEVIRVTNEQFVSIRRDDLRGDFDLKLTISTAEESNAKAQELSYMLQTMGNSIPFELTKIVLSEIAKLRKMPDLAKELRTFEQQPSEIDQKRQELEMAKLEAEVQLLQAQAQEEATKAQVNEAKVGVEQARAENLQSQADNNALDFVHKQEGVDQHQRMQMEEQKANNRLIEDSYGTAAQLFKQGLKDGF